METIFDRIWVSILDQKDSETTKPLFLVTLGSVWIQLASSTRMRSWYLCLAKLCPKKKYLWKYF